LLLRGPSHDRAAAERLYREAITVAAGQQAKSLELRAATSLALLLRDEGKRDEARNLLAPVYGWFTEGFDTLDLKEAKALLDVLAS
jgi:predicted ATPase